MRVYLAGPIAGLTYDTALDWRVEAAAKLKEYDQFNVILSPMRAKEALRGTKVLRADWDYPAEGPLSAHAVFMRDTNDIRTSDVVLANLLGAPQISIGTMIELGIAHEARIPVITVMTPEDKHWHIFVREVSSLIVPTLETAIAWIGEVLE